MQPKISDTSDFASPPPLAFSPEIRRLLSQALFEDVGSGDITSLAVIPDNQMGAGVLFSKSSGVLCGCVVAEYIMRLVDAEIQITFLQTDGAPLSPGVEIARLHGPLRSILTGERVMLNFIQRLSGIATLTRQYVDKVREAGGATRIMDTRKTTPLWRPLERYAVRTGGGQNHRFALYDAYLIKNNHADAAGGVREALRRVHQHNAGQDRTIAVEARNLDEVNEILQIGADLILLDNMTIPEIRAAAAQIGHQAEIEITGGVTLENISDYSALGVDRISVGALTHSAPALDIALHWKEMKNRDATQNPDNKD